MVNSIVADLRAEIARETSEDWLTTLERRLRNMTIAKEALEAAAAWRPIDYETIPRNRVIQVLSRGSKEIVSLYYDQPEGFQGWWRYASYPNRGTHAGWDWTHWREIGDLP